ncbi:MAG: hypothetical protein RBS19_01180 [Bacteroidales bacterium]|nr:hypothetical protein [Bacteroidales bacterium]
MKHLLAWFCWQWERYDGFCFNKDTHSYTLRMKANLESAHPFQETFEVDLVNYGHMELKK